MFVRLVFITVCDHNGDHCRSIIYSNESHIIINMEMNEKLNTVADG